MKRTQVEILTDYVQGVNTMIDASSQMIHQFGNIKFMAVRDILQIVKKATVGKIDKNGGI